MENEQDNASVPVVVADDPLAVYGEVDPDGSGPLLYRSAFFVPRRFPPASPLYDFLRRCDRRRSASPLHRFTTLLFVLEDLGHEIEARDLETLAGSDGATVLRLDDELAAVLGRPAVVLPDLKTLVASLVPPSPVLRDDVHFVAAEHAAFLAFADAYGGDVRRSALRANDAADADLPSDSLGREGVLTPLSDTEVSSNGPVTSVRFEAAEMRCGIGTTAREREDWILEREQRPVLAPLDRVGRLFGLDAASRRYWIESEQRMDPPFLPRPRLPHWCVGPYHRLSPEGRALMSEAFWIRSNAMLLGDAVDKVRALLDDPFAITRLRNWSRDYHDYRVVLDLLDDLRAAADLEAKVIERLFVGIWPARRPPTDGTTPGAAAAKRVVLRDAASALFEAHVGGFDAGRLEYDLETVFAMARHAYATLYPANGIPPLDAFPLRGPLDTVRGDERRLRAVVLRHMVGAMPATPTGRRPALDLLERTRQRRRQRRARRHRGGDHDGASPDLRRRRDDDDGPLADLGASDDDGPDLRARERMPPPSDEEENDDDDDRPPPLLFPAGMTELSRRYHEASTTSLLAAAPPVAETDEPLDPDSECVACKHARATVALLHERVYHLSLCYACSLRYRSPKCPLCRETIVKRVFVPPEPPSLAAADVPA